MTYSAKLPDLKTLLSGCAMSQLSRCLAMHTRDTAPAGKVCESFPHFLYRLHIHLNTNSNPLLAETFEIPQLKFVAEKVSHHPVVMAYHAEGEGWELYATSSGRTKFWGA
jgi:Oxysterol-binding protein